MSDSDSRLSTTIPEDLDERLEEILDYGDSKAAWVREAIRQRLRRECDTDDCS